MATEKGIIEKYIEDRLSELESVSKKETVNEKMIRLTRINELLKTQIWVRSQSE